MDKPAPKNLKAAFDKTFDRYCTQLRIGIPTRMFVADTLDNHLLVEEFKRYLNQRAEVEGWAYDTNKFQVVYTNAADLPSRRTIHLNPRDKNVAFQEVDPERGIFTRVGQEEADGIVARVKRYLR